MENNMPTGFKKPGPGRRSRSRKRSRSKKRSRSPRHSSHKRKSRSRSRKRNSSSGHKLRRRKETIQHLSQGVPKMNSSKEDGPMSNPMSSLPGDLFGNQTSIATPGMGPRMPAMQPGLSQTTPPLGVPNEVMEQLMRTLRSPTSPQQQQQVKQILKSYPQLMALFIKQRNPPVQGAGGMAPGPMQPRPNNPQMQAMAGMQQNQTLSHPQHDML